MAYIFIVYVISLNDLHQYHIYPNKSRQSIKNVDNFLPYDAYV